MISYGSVKSGRSCWILLKVSIHLLNKRLWSFWAMLTGRLHYSALQTVRLTIPFNLRWTPGSSRLLWTIWLCGVRLGWYCKRGNQGLCGSCCGADGSESLWRMFVASRTISRAWMWDGRKSDESVTEQHFEKGGEVWSLHLRRYTTDLRVINYVNHGCMKGLLYVIVNSILVFYLFWNSELTWKVPALFAHAINSRTKGCGTWSLLHRFK